MSVIYEDDHTIHNPDFQYHCCPFNRSHYMPASRLANHIVKCPEKVCLLVTVNSVRTTFFAEGSGEEA